MRTDLPTPQGCFHVQDSIQGFANSVIKRLRWYLDNKDATSDTPGKKPNPQPKPTDPTEINEDVNLDLERLEALEEFLQQFISLDEYKQILNSEIFL